MRKIRLKKKKKEDKFVMMKLEKDGEIIDVDLKFSSLMQKAKAVKKLTGYMRKGWNLIDVSGNSEHVASMKKLIDGYQPGDKIPVKKMVVESGSKVLPGFIRKHLTKEELEESQDPGS